MPAVMHWQREQKLAALGFTKIDTAAALGRLLGRRVSPGSEVPTPEGLCKRAPLWVNGLTMTMAAPA